MLSRRKKNDPVPLWQQHNCQTRQCPICKAKAQRRDVVLRWRAKNPIEPKPRKVSCQCGKCQTCRQRIYMRRYRQLQERFRGPHFIWLLSLRLTTCQLSTVHSCLDPRYWQRFIFTKKERLVKK